jgi:hypothetical protein
LGEDETSKGVAEMMESRERKKREKTGRFDEQGR